jgi:hypothetical protein
MNKQLPSVLQLPSLRALLGFVILLCAAAPAMAQNSIIGDLDVEVNTFDTLTTPSLGDAEDFALLAGSTVTVAAIGSVITGHVGVSPGTSITGIPAGATLMGSSAVHSNTAEAIAAQASCNALYVDLVGTGGAIAIPAELGGTTVTPGTYSFSSSANIAAGTTLTLDGAGVYIFKVGSAITANVLSNVVLQNGASSCQVFWQVTSAATLNGVTFSGTVVAQAAVTVGVGATLYGRALATTAGAVTLAGGATVICDDGSGGGGGGLVYSVTNLVIGSIATFSVSGATPSGAVRLGYSKQGAGPTTTVYGVVDMSLPITLFAILTADVSGNAAFGMLVPACVTGVTVYSQAVDIVSGNLSNALVVLAL